MASNTQPVRIGPDPSKRLGSSKSFFSMRSPSLIDRNMPPDLYVVRPLLPEGEALPAADDVESAFCRSEGDGGGVTQPLLSTAEGTPVASLPGSPGGRQQPASAPLQLSPAEASLQKKLTFAYNLSWVINFALFGAKLFVYRISNSQAVLASLVDSFVDIISQLIIFVAEHRSKQADDRYPVGRTRLETMGVLSCACIMTISAYMVVQSSTMALYDGIVDHNLPDLEAGVLMYSVLGGATALKFVCYIFCVALQGQSDSMIALAEDHLNDIVSNVAAAATAVLAVNIAGGWWLDPAGGIAISLFIVIRWIMIASSQVDKIVGRGAPVEFLAELSALANTHHDNLTVDCIRAYHFGSRFMVEMEVVMPAEFSLRQVHDISLLLQVKLEELSDVERAFVHVDYAHRDEPEHRTDRVLRGLQGLPSM